MVRVSGQHAETGGLASPQPLRFVCSTRLGSFGDDARHSSTEPISKRLAKHPDLRFKLDPENDWDAELIAELKEIAGVDVLDLKGLYRGTPVDVETDPELYAAVAGESWNDCVERRLMQSWAMYRNRSGTASPTSQRSRGT